ncbi:putative pectinesterase/pectinesterase inhibitor 28 [Acorus calamus]|uniref:Pectinesterase n=1 Tax=Acorus calamus TaxID=4465 RepID=A0AAV9CRA1_ACOCL|nr:putative pectinesterase/pectinesterase inhibitor 28 [Acorus calamus]
MTSCPAYNHLAGRGGDGGTGRGSSAKKYVAGGLSAVLLIAVVLGVVAVTLRSTHHIGSNVPDPTSSSAGDGLSTSAQYVSSFCASTDYKDTCQKSLGPLLTAKSGPKEVVTAAIKVAIGGVQVGLDKAKDVAKGVTEPMQKAALSDCEELLNYAIEELKDSIGVVGGGGDNRSLSERADDLKSWLSAVISYQETCVDGVTHPELQSAVKVGLVNATQMTSNALAIVAGLETSLDAMKIPFKLPTMTNGRRLMEATEGGYPEWFSAADRRLLAQHTKGNVKPNVVVAKDGSGNFKSISDALDAMPAQYSGRYVIYVKAGLYDESPMVTKKMVNVFMYGDGPRKTIVTGHKNFVDGTPTFQTATFAAIGNGFIAKSMGFQNTAGAEKHQAVALRVQSDMSAFFNCRMDGFQDTLYAQTHRQFYRNCVVSGTIDFIFGDSSVVFQNCLIIVRRPMDNQQNTVTAHGRADRHETTGIVIQNCRIVPDRKLYPVRLRIKSYLGRPWKEYSRTVVMESMIGDLIQPDGWMPWDGNFALNTLFYAEYANRGAGANTARRVRWPGFKVIKDRNEAMQYTVGRFIQGGLWLKYTQIPHFVGLKN